MNPLIIFASTNHLTMMDPTAWTTAVSWQLYCHEEEHEHPFYRRREADLIPVHPLKVEYSLKNKWPFLFSLQTHGNRDRNRDSNSWPSPPLPPSPLCLLIPSSQVKAQQVACGAAIAVVISTSCWISRDTRWLCVRFGSSVALLQSHLAQSPKNIICNVLLVRQEPWSVAAIAIATILIATILHWLWEKSWKLWMVESSCCIWIYQENWINQLELVEKGKLKMAAAGKPMFSWCCPCLIYCLFSSITCRHSALPNRIVGLFLLQCTAILITINQTNMYACWSAILWTWREHQCIIISSNNNNKILTL